MSGQYKITNISLSITAVLSIAIINANISQSVSMISRPIYFAFVAPYEWLIIGDNATDRTIAAICLAAILAPINAAAIWFQVKLHTIEYIEDYNRGTLPNMKSIIKWIFFSFAARAASLYFLTDNPAPGMIRTYRDLGLWNLLHMLSAPFLVLTTSCIGMLFSMLLATPNLKSAKSQSINSIF